jgi:hypothetical protein
MDSTVSDKTRSNGWGNNRLRARLEAGEPMVGLTITTINFETAVLGAKHAACFQALGIDVFLCGAVSR